MFWGRKRGKQVVIYDYVDGRQVALPRSLSRHLDGEPDHNVEFYVRELERRREARGDRALSAPPKYDLPTPLVKLVKGYGDYQESRGRSPKTIKEHRHLLLDMILPFFVVIKGHEQPNAWPPHAAEMTRHVRERTGSEHVVRKANSALKGFWDWVTGEKAALHGLTLRVRAPARAAAPTPLARVVEPDEVLAWAGAQTAPEIALLGLLGYFFSLRPQESFALRPRDFRAGSAAASLESGRQMARHGQYTRLAVHIVAQRTQDGALAEPKAHSKGWVSCFSEPAARRIVELLRGRDPDARIFATYQNDWYFKLWKRGGVTGITLKDLRRASLYWLGQRVGFDFVALQGHARHKKPETTLLYLRRPEEEVIPGELDLDA